MCLKRWPVNRALVVFVLSALISLFADEAGAQWFQVRNTGGGSPNAPATIYLGDTGLTFGCDAWGTLGGQWGGATVYIHTGSDIHNGTAGAAISYTSTDAKSNASGQFTSSGTWYWGVRMQYNTSGTIVGWYCRNNGTWADAWGTPISDLTLTVNALGDPTGVSAITNTANPTTEIDVSWSQWNSKNVMAVRSTSSNFTAPTQGSSYSTGATIGSGTVVYNNSGSTYTDTSLTANTTYYYKFYSANNSYYSAGAGANETTEAVPISNPTINAAAVDGQEAVNLSWTKSGGLDVMVVKSTGSTATKPTDTTAYNVGDALGSGHVIYNGSAETFKAVELTDNQLWYFFYYSVDGADNYSDGLTNSATTTSFGADEWYDSFSYTNGNYLDTKDLGNGFSTAWNENTAGNWVVVSTNFSAATGYPAERGHAVSVTPTTATGTNILRTFPSVSAGEIFVGYMVRYQYDENDAGTDGKYVGMALADGGTEEIFFGEVDSIAQAIGVDPQGDGVADDAGLDSMVNAANFIVIGKYNFATRRAAVAIYTNAAAVPTSEPTTWAAETTMTTGPAEIDGIRLETGASSGTPGESIFDEIRVGRSWGDMVRTASYIFDDGGSGHDWSTAGNWSSATEPTSANNAYVGNSLTAVVSQASEAANNLDIADGTAQTGAVQQTAGSLTISGDLTLGDDYGNKGTYLISGGTLTVVGTTHIGDAGLGQMTVYGASSDVNFQGVLTVGDGSTDENNGSYLHIDDATVTVDGQFYLGASAQGADGTLIMSGGVFEANSVFNIGEVNSSTGRVYVKDGSIVGGSSDDIYVGDAGYGFMQVSGGTVDVNGTGGDIFIGDDANGGRVNELEVTGGLVDVENNIEMGDSSGASGLLDIQGGRLEIGDDLYVGDAASGTGTVTMVGGTMKADNLYVGNAGVGVMTLGGGAVTASVFSVGQASGGSGSATITNGLLYIPANADLFVGNAGTGILNLGGDGQITLNAGATHPAIIGNAAGGTGTVNQTGGRVDSLDNTDFIIGNVSGASAVYKLSGGTLDLGATGGNNGDDLTVSNGTMHLVGVNWTNVIDDDLFVGPSGQMTFEFSSSAIHPFEVDDDINIISGSTLNITNDGGGISDGTYVIITSLNASAISAKFTTTNWLGGVTGTVSYTDGRVAVTFADLTEAALFVGPTSLSYTSMVGVAPASQTFTVTNSGQQALYFTNTIAYGSGSGWLIVAPSTGSISGVSTLLNTGAVTVAGMSAGVYTATNNVDGNQTNTAVDVVVTLTLTNIPDVASATATADGSEFVDLAWTKAPGDLQVLIVHRAGAAPSADPSQNTSYTVGQSLGSGKVIYKGSGTSLEHVVGEGTVNYYNFYSMTNSHYSPGLQRTASSTSYDGHEIVDQFAYTNGVTLNSLNGGQGWSGSWTESTSGQYTLTNYSFSSVSGFPTNHANAIHTSSPQNDSYTARRTFTAVTADRIYGACFVNFQYNGPSKWSGMSFMDGTTEEAFFGEIGGVDTNFGLSSYDGASYTGSGDNMSLTTDYLIIGSYDFSTRKFRGLIYGSAESVPTTEPATWDVEVTVPPGNITSINGIRLGSGEYADSGYVGDVYFDEVRVATNWGQLLNQAATYNIGNAWHIPSNAEPATVTMRSPVTEPSTNQTVYFYNGNQYQGTGNSGDQSGGTLYHRVVGGGGWTSTNLYYDSASGNNKYWVTDIPPGTYTSGQQIEYYFKITYTDHDNTYIGTTNNGVGNVLKGIESWVQTNTFKFTYSTQSGLAPAYVWHAANRVVSSGSNVEFWVKVGYAEGIGSNKWADYSSIYYTTDGATPSGGYGSSSNGSTIEASMSFDHMEWDSYPDGDAMWWVGKVTNLPLQTTIKYKIGAWKTTGTYERFADYNAATDNQVFSFELGTTVGDPELTVNGLSANYTTTKLFVDEIAGDTQEVVIVFTPNAAELDKVEVFSNIGRRDYVDVDYTNANITADGYPDGINPPDGNYITTNDTGAYFTAFPMVHQGGGVYIWTARVDRCGAYRVSARYSTNNQPANTWQWYTSTAANRRDHAVVVTPKKALALTMYELNVPTVEAVWTDQAGRSTFEDLLGAADGDSDGFDPFNLDYLNLIQANTLWFQPIHPNKIEREKIYTPGSPYSVRNFFAIAPHMGSANTEADAFNEFTNFVAKADAYGGSVGTINVILDSVLNHAAWDAEMGAGGVELGYTTDPTNRIAAERVQWFANLSNYGTNATYYNTAWDNDMAAAPDRGDFGKWTDTTEFFFGDYAALVHHNPEDNGDYLNEGDWFDYDNMSTNTMELWKYMAHYAEYWLTNTGHAVTNAWDQTEDDKGIDGLRCDFGQGLPPQFWEYLMNRTRTIKWNFVFMSETLDGGVPGYRSNRHFDILNESIVFQFTASHINHPADLRNALEDRRNSYNNGLILLNLTSHDEVLPDNDTWLNATRYGAVSTVDGIPMVFYGQEQGSQNYNTDGAFWYYDGFRADHELNFGKYVANFKEWNQLSVWSNPPPSATGLDQWYGRVNWARLNSPALQGQNRYFLTNMSGNDNSRIFAVAKYEEANASPTNKDVVLAFALLFEHGAAHASAADTYDLTGAWSLLGLDVSKNYNVRNLASSDANSYVWTDPISGQDLYDNGIYVSLGGGTVNAITNDGELVQYLKVEEITTPVATNYSVYGHGDNLVYDSQIADGSYSVKMHFYDSSGMATNSIYPNFAIRNAAGTEVVASNRFVNISWLNGGTTMLASNGSVATVASGSIDTGTYVLAWAGVNSNGVTAVGQTNLEDSTLVTFTVTDDDTGPPSIGGSSGDWQVFYNLPDQNSFSPADGEFVVRTQLIYRLDHLNSGHTGTLFTYTWSGDTDANGFAGPVLTAMSNALVRGATLRFIGDSGVNTNTVYGSHSLASLGKHVGNPLLLSIDDSASGIMHDKLGLFDCGAGERYVMSGSHNFTAGAATYQWNIMLEIKSDALYAAYYSEAEELMAGRFHDDASKSHVHDNTTFSLGGSWGANFVRFAPYPDGSVGGNNAQTDITNLIAGAQDEIFFALNAITRPLISSQLIAAVNADQTLSVHGVIPEYERTNVTAFADTSEQYDIMTNSANYTGTNRVHFHTAWADGDHTTVDDGSSHDLVHAKYMIIDPFGSQPIVIHGSPNWTASGLVYDDTNDENLQVLRHQGIASYYFENWTKITGVYTGRVNLVSGASLEVFGGTDKLTSSGVGTNTIWTITDGNLLTNDLHLHFHVYDQGSGISRGTTTASTNMNMNVDNLTTNNVTNFVLATSSATTTDSSSTSVWTFVSFSTTIVGNMFGTNGVTADIPDADADYPGDILWTSNQLFGYIAVIDDDTNTPTASGFVIYGSEGLSTVTVAELTSGSGWAITGLVQDVDSGVNIDGASVVQPTNSPYFVLYSPTGTAVLTNVFDAAFTDGQADASAGAVSNASLGTVSSPATGIWTARVVVTDNDFDRTGDQLTITNEYTFEVISTPQYITVDAFIDKHIIQRVGTNGSLQLSGTYTGTPTAIEARIVSTNGSEITAWATVDASPSGETWSGTVSGIPEGGWYRVETRYSNATSVTNDTSNRFGVGILIAFLGQSNIAKMFSTSNNTDVANQHLSYFGYDDYSDNHLGDAVIWRDITGAGHNGNGGIRLGNDLRSELGIPVGLMNFSIGSTRITQWTNATWYGWTQFVGGVETVGSDFEMVVWHQGAADALAGVTKTQYKSNLDALYSNITNLVPSARQTNLPFLCAIQNRGDYGAGYDDDYNAVRGAQLEWPTEAPNASMKFRAGNSIDMIHGGWLGDGWGHWQPTSYALMADRYAQSALHALGEPGYTYGGGGGVMTTGVLYDNKIILSFQQDGGTKLTVTNSSVNIAGFEVSTNNFVSTLGIATAELYNADTQVRLVFSNDLSGNVEVRYLYGMNPFGGTSATNPANILYDDAAYSGGRTGLPINGTVDDLAVYGTSTYYRIRFDFGDATFATADNWNNVTNSTQGTTIIDAIATNGEATRVDLEITDDFSTINTGGTTSPDAGLGYPSSATRDSLWGNTNLFAGELETNAQLTISGLDTSGEYRFTFFASRVTGGGDNRETAYLVSGAAGSTNTVYLDPVDNTSQKVTTIGITPDGSGQVVINIRRGPNNTNPDGFYYLGVMEISQEAYVDNPASTSAAVDGEEAVDLSWTQNGSGDNVMVVRSTASSAAKPSNGTAYTAGDAIGSGVVAYNGSSTTHKDTELAQSTGYYYFFYSVDGSDNYSDGLTNSVTTDTFGQEIYDSFSYTNGVLADGKSGGTGWTNAWNGGTLLGAGEWVMTNGVPGFENDFSGYPTNHGHITTMTSDGNGGKGTNDRHFVSVTNGTIFFGGIVSYQYWGVQKWAGIELMDGSTARMFIGKYYSLTTTNTFGIQGDGGAWTATSSYDVNPREGTGGNTGNVYLVIGKYNFDEQRAEANAYYRTVSTPKSEPTTWSSDYTLSSPFTKFDGLRLRAGAASGSVGHTFFDEVRVARTWGDLLELDPPKVTNFSINAGDTVYDSQINSGSFTVRMSFASAKGVETVSTSGDFFKPNFDIFNSIGTQVLTDEVFDVFSHTSPTAVDATDSNSVGVGVSSVTLGVYTSRWSAINSNECPELESIYNTNFVKLTFTVVDDDTTAPSNFNFNVDGQTYTNTDLASGLEITGQVQDAQSGVFAGSSNTYSLTRGGAVVSSGSFSTAPSVNGYAKSAAEALAVTIPASVITNAGSYVLYVTNINYDVDRTDDHQSGTSSYAFTVVEPSVAPGLDVTPATFTIETMVGTDPSDFTFTVTNTGIGTLFFTNYITYGNGSGWLDVAPADGTVAEAGGQICTGSVTVAGMSAGIYTATNRVDGNQTNSATNVVITLTLTNIPNPTVFTATADGKEFVDLAWTKAGSLDVLLLYREVSAPSASPTNGDAYAIGDPLGGGTVVYKGSASSFEHVVSTNKTHYYIVYSMNNDHYSAGSSDNDSTTSYQSYEIVDSMSYTNGVGIDGLSGGHGWTNDWALNGGTMAMVSSGLAGAVNYPVAHGNALQLDPDNGNASAWREFDRHTTGAIYMSYVLNATNLGSGRYAVIDVYDKATKVAAFGVIGGATAVGIEQPSVASRTTTNEVNYKGDVTIIGKYDFTSDKFFVSAFYTNSVIPTVEPSDAGWNTNLTWSGEITGINKMMLTVGTWTSTDPGFLLIDEFRVATNYYQLLNMSLPSDPPTGRSATADGEQAVDLSWEQNGDNDNVMIVRSTSSTATAPTNGDTYAVGASLGSGSVVFNGSSLYFKDVELTETTPYYYFFYSVGSATNYSIVVTNTATTDTFEPTEIYESFSYDVDENLSLKDGGNGWTQHWVSAGGAITNWEESLVTPTGYPTNHGHMVKWTSPGSDSSVVYNRFFEPVNSGKLFVSYVLSTETNTGNRYAGLRWMSNNTIRMFTGLRGGQAVAGAEQADVAVSGNTATVIPSHGNDNIHSNAVLIITMFDFSDETFHVNAYTSLTEAVESFEPTTWDLELSLTADYVQSINGIQLAAGGYGGTDAPDTYWDEIRVATNRYNLLDTESLPSPPTGTSAASDGEQAVDLSWTQNGSGHDVLVVRSTGSSPTASPTNTDTYAVGASLGAGTVIFNGSDTSFKDVELAENTTYYYFFYSVNGTAYYSQAVTNNATTEAFDSGEIYESFSYDLGADLNTKNAGNGFESAWSTSAGTFTNCVSPFSDVSGYPQVHGHAIASTGSGDDDMYLRSIFSTNEGTVYVGFMMKYGSDDWSGLSFQNSGTEELFIGERGAEQNMFGIQVAGGGSSDALGSDSMVIGTEYTVIAKIDFDAGTPTFEASIYTNDTESVPLTEPGTWDISTTFTAGQVPNINQIRIAAGTTSATWFDEIRLATTYEGLLAQSAPVATNYSVNGGSDVTDAAITGGTYSVVIDLFDGDGMATNATFPSFDIKNAAGTKIVTNEFFLHNIFGATSLKSSNSVLTSTVASAGVDLGDYTLLFSAIDSNGVTATDVGTLSNGTAMTFTVIDDDTTSPQVVHFDISGGTSVTATNLQAGDIAIIGFNSDGNDDFAFVTFANLPAATDIYFTDLGWFSGNFVTANEGAIKYTTPAGGLPAGTVVVISDPGGTPSADTGTITTPDAGFNVSGTGDQILSYQIAGGATTFLFAVNQDSTDWVSGDASDKSEVPAGLTDGIDAIHAAKNLGAAANIDNGEYIGMRTGTIQQLKSAITNSANWHFDEDTAYTLSSGDFSVSGGKLLKRVADGTITNGGWSFTGLVQDVTSGIDADGSPGSDPFPPHYDLLVSDGGAPAAWDNLTFDSTPSDGGAKSSAEALADSSVPGIAATDVEIGTYTAKVYVADNDHDRTGDRLSTTASWTFDIYDDDTNSPTTSGFVVQGTEGISTVTVSELTSAAGWSVTGLVNDADSGVNVAGALMVQPTNSPYFILLDPNGSEKLTNVFDASFADGGTGGVSNDTLSAISSPATGTWTVRVVVTDNDFDRADDQLTSTSEYTFVVITGPPGNPSGISLSADGEQAADLSWTRNANNDDVMVVRSTDAVGIAPTNGDAYTVGDPLGANGMVIFNGSSTAFKDVELTESTLYYYFFYSVDGSVNYSHGLTNNVTTETFGADEWYESFSYDLGDDLDGKNLGNGFTNEWSASAAATWISVGTNFSSVSGYSSEHGHAVSVTPPDVTTRTATRGIEAVNCGKLYISYMVRYQYPESAENRKFVGASFMDGSTEELFFGEVTNLNQAVGVDLFGDGSESDAGAGTMGEAQNYVVIGAYDFDSKQAKVLIYTNAATIPQTEPSTWSATTTMSTGPTEINGIQLSAGAKVAGNPGECLFDEVRVARTWGDVLEQAPPRLTNYVVDVDNLVSDGQMTGGVYVISVDMYSTEGIDSDGTPFTPNFDILNANGQVLTDEDFDTFNYRNSTSVSATSTSHIVGYANNVLGVHTVQVSAAASNGAQTIDQNLQIDDCTKLEFTVYDDDTNNPTFYGFHYPDAAETVNGKSCLEPGDIAIIGFNYDNPDDFTFVTLVDIAAGSEIKFTDDGWQKSHSFVGGEGVVTWTNAALVSAGTKVTITNANSTDITADVGTAERTSGSFALASDGDGILAYQGPEAAPVFIYALNSEGNGWQNDATDANSSALPLGLKDGSTAIAVSESDNSVYNMSTVTATRSELLVAIGNPNNWSGSDVTRQTVPPAGSFSVTGGGQAYAMTDAQMKDGGWSFTGLIYDAQSGVNADGSPGDAYPTYPPHYDINVSDGGAPAAWDHVAFDITPSDGEGTTAVELSATNVAALGAGDIELGTYTVTVYAVDNDTDRASDALTLQGYSRFCVVDDDTNNPSISAIKIWGSEGMWTVTVAELSGASGWAITGLVTDADSGINVNGTSYAQPDNSPYFVLLDSSGAPKLTNVFDAAFADGGTGPVSNGTLAAITSLSTGTWTARVVVTDADDDRTDDQLTVTSEYAFVVVSTAVDNPGGITVSPDGEQAMDLSWSLNGSGDNVLVLRSTSSTAGAFPTNSDTYAVGDLIGNGEVVYTGTGTAYKDVELGSNTAYYYFFYSRNATTEYSTGLTNNNTTDNTFKYYEIYESFSYTNAVGIDGKSGGVGWSGAWAGGDGSISNASMAAPPNYPETHGHQLVFTDPGVNLGKSHRRDFDAIECGSLFISYIVSPEKSGASQWTGIDLLSNGTARFFIGARGSSDKLGVEISSGATWDDGSYSITGWNADTGNVHAVILKYDFDTRKLQANAYWANGTTPVPTNEPGTWDAEITVPAGWATSLDGMTLKIGGHSGDTAGTTFFDEIRVGRTWSEMLAESSPRLTNYAVNSGTDVTDAEMTGGVYSVSVDLYSDEGVLDGLSVTNFSFELPDSPVGDPDPDAWQSLTSGPDTAGVVESGYARTGDQVLQFYVPSGATDVGDYQEYYHSFTMDLTPEDEVYFNAYLRMRPDNPMPTGTTAKIGIEFRGNGSESNRVETWVTSEDLESNRWTGVSVNGKPIGNIDEIRCTIIMSKDNNAPSDGYFWVDDASAGFHISPNFDIVNPSGVSAVTNEYFDTVTYNGDN
ncbi:MAG: hypothetical protein KJ626_10985 [Verrucomicrobia bacterium]|nr:hypothetical protein [Verrucomicrobiota bacterium]